MWGNNGCGGDNKCSHGDVVNILTDNDDGEHVENEKDDDKDDEDDDNDNLRSSPSRITCSPLSLVSITSGLSK